MRNTFLVLALFSLFVLASCEQEALIHRDFEIEGGSWEASDAKSFTFEMGDTITRRNFRIHLRNDQEYPYSNMYLFVELTFPNGKRRIDTLNCPLATPEGKWLGNSFGGMVDHRIKYLDNVSFPLEGDYEVKIIQAMRQDPLPGVHNIGFSIE